MSFLYFKKVRRSHLEDCFKFLLLFTAESLQRCFFPMMEMSLHQSHEFPEFVQASM